MKKRNFWFVMCMVSIINGGLFFGASLKAMQRGLEGIENQAALLFIPFLWILAAFVLILLNAYTLIRGVRIPKEQIFSMQNFLRQSGLSRKEKAGRLLFILTACLLMVFGYSLFAAERAYATAYALSGGMLLLFLYNWERAAAQKAHR